MSMTMRAVALAAAIAAGFASPVSGAERKPAAPDDFAKACVARGKSSPQRCACESKLARATLDAAERSAMIRGISGDQAGFQTALARMDDVKRRGFTGKMQQLQARSARECQ